MAAGRWRPGASRDPFPWFVFGITAIAATSFLVYGLFFAPRPRSGPDHAVVNKIVYWATLLQFVYWPWVTAGLVTIYRHRRKRLNLRPQEGEMAVTLEISRKGWGIWPIRDAGIAVEEGGRLVYSGEKLSLAIGPQDVRDVVRWNEQLQMTLHDGGTLNFRTTLGRDGRTLARLRDLLVEGPPASSPAELPPTDPLPKRVGTPLP